MSMPENSHLDTAEVMAKVTAVAEQKKLKSYYCLQLSLGNIPSEVVAAHAVFFKWLECKS